jgi:hypothetical protein
VLIVSHQNSIQKTRLKYSTPMWEIFLLSFRTPNRRDLTSIVLKDFPSYFPFVTFAGSSA